MFNLPINKKKKVRVQLTLTTGIWQQGFGDEILEKMEKNFIWNKEMEECAENTWKQIYNPNQIPVTLIWNDLEFMS